MKRLLSILMLCVLVCACVDAQIVTPIHWSSEVVGDSVRVSASIDDGWHMTIFAIGNEEAGAEYEELSDTFTMMLPEPMAIRYNACDDWMCTAPEVWTPTVAAAETQPSASPTTAPSQRSLWVIFVLGLLGGVLAIFTPCVWPIIPMTVSFFLKKGAGVKDAVTYGLSIIVIYVGLGLIVTLIFGASALNELATNAVVNIFFFLLLVVFALSFFGLFEITLPSSWSTKLDGQARQLSPLNSSLATLLMAFTLVIVSFSCTAPIIGTLLVEAAGRSLLAPTVGMLGFAIALALPFSLFALFPRWIQSMPKSGDWMQSFKVTLAFIELALSLKFLSVADMAYGWGILPRWLFIALWIACFVGLGGYLLVRVIRRTHTNKTMTIIGLIVAAASLGFAGYLVPGLWGASVKAIAAFAPAEEAKVFHDYEEGLAFARATNKPVLLDFTGYGCVNCRKMEAYVLSDEHVQERLQHYVVIELFVDDRQMQRGETNARIQREVYGSNAQPFFVQLNAQGQCVAEPYGFSVDVEDFLEWLQY